MAQKYLKEAVARFRECSYAWSNLGMFIQISDNLYHFACSNLFFSFFWTLGISIQLSEEPLKAEDVYKQALACAASEQAHAILSNLGNFYRQQKQYERAKAMFSKALELQPGYAPAYNNLGLVFIAEHQLEEAKFCFGRALQSDPVLDAAMSNMIKAVALSRLCSG